MMALPKVTYKFQKERSIYDKWKSVLVCKYKNPCVNVYVCSHAMATTK